MPGVEQFYTQRCHCPELEDFWKKAEKLDWYAKECTAYAAMLKEDDSILQNAFKNLCKEWTKEFETYAWIGGECLANGSVIMKVPDGEDRKNLPFLDRIRGKHGEYNLYCANCRAQIPKIAYRGWTSANNI